MSDEEVTIVSTDDAILNAIGEGDEQTTEESTTEETTGTGDDTTQETSTAGSEQGVEGQLGTEQQQLMVPKTSLVGMVKSLPPEEEREGSTKPRRKRRVEQMDSKDKSKRFKAK